jgi:hypothetical protein
MTSKSQLVIGSALIGIAIPYVAYSLVYGSVTLNQLRDGRQNIPRIEREVANSAGIERFFFGLFSPARQIAFKIYSNKLNSLNQTQ